MPFISIDVHCQKCDEKYPMLVDKDKRNDPQLCDLCDGGMAIRVWSVPNVSTAKTSASIPDNVAAGRFDALRDQHEMRKEVSKAKRAYVADPSSKNAAEVKRLRKEKTKTDNVRR
jgi:hypothetical protein